MAKAKKKFNYKTKIMSMVRRLWLYSPMRREAMKRNVTDDGFHRCEKCLRLTEEINIDHSPSVVPVEGFDSYDAVFERMFCESDKLKKLCLPCHDEKTKEENRLRKENRAKKLKGKDKNDT